jgi:isopropylmalate/homocitrate/citramalate synthase
MSVYHASISLMPAKHKINPERVYYNFEGRMPQVPVEDEPALRPAAEADSKLITDTTLRDGAQDSRFALFPNEARLRYVDLLHDLDNGTGRIHAIETFIYQKRDLWVLDKLLEREYDHPKVTTWIRANPKDVRQLHEVSQGRVKETGMLASSSDHHIFDKLGFRSKEEAVDKYLRPILTARELGITPRVHLEDCTRADIFGWVIPFMRTVLEETEGTARFRVCDTIGWGSPDPYAALPQGVPRLISTLVAETGAELEFHGHNDFGLATANSLAAWRYGARKVNVAFGGLGERTGNTSLEQVVAGYVRHFGDPGFNHRVLADMRRLVEEELVPLSPTSPIIGDVFTTQAGIHQAGVARQDDAPGGLIYLAYDPALVGAETAERSLVGALSGSEGIVSILNREAEDRGLEVRFSNASRVVKEIYDRVQEAYDGTYDEASDSWRDYRKGFFQPNEIWDIAVELGATDVN